MFSAPLVTASSSVPAAPAAASSSARCRPAAADSAESDSRRRCPRDARRWLRTALAIVMLGSACCVSTAQVTWSTAQLSVARSGLRATSVGNVAIFAGGFDMAGNYSLTLFVEGLLFGLMRVGDGAKFACLRRGACCLLCLRCRRLPSDGGHCRNCKFQCCGLVRQCIGQMVDRAAQCGAPASCCDICWERGHLRGWSWT
jgi:hypothetical protein